jgi:peptide/nickel transport system substrate-binding protein
MVSGDPFTCTWLFTDFPRSDRVVLEANTDHWNRERGPRLEKVVYVNDIDPAEALEKVCNTEGEIDVVSEVSPATPWAPSAPVLPCPSSKSLWPAPS